MMGGGGALACALVAPAHLPRGVAGQRVKEGELDVRFDTDSHRFVSVQPDRGDEPIELAPEPSWNRVAYVRRYTPRATRGYRRERQRRALKG